MRSPGPPEGGPGLAGARLEAVITTAAVSDGVNPRLFDGEDAVFGFAGVQT